MIKRMTAGAAIAAAVLVAFTAGASGATPQQHRVVDTTVLRQWTPGNQTAMRAEIPYSLAHLAKAWLLAGDRKRAGRLLDELARRGDDALTLGSEWAPFPTVTTVPNPADTIYTVDVAIAAEAFRDGGRKAALNHALELLKAMPRVDGGGCLAYDARDAAAGCVHDSNAYVLALFSRIKGVDYQPLLDYETRTMHQDGTWWFWEDAPKSGAYSLSVEDPGHLSGMAFEYLDSPDPRVRALGHAAAGWLERNYTGPDEQPFWAYPTVIQAEVADGYQPACDEVGTLAAWADAHPTAASIAALVVTWAQTRC